MCIRLKPWIIATLAGTTLLATLTSCSEPPTKEVVNPGKLVKTLVLNDEQQNYYREYPGRVNAAQKVEMSFENAGRIVILPVKEGDEVKQGDLIAKIDPRDYQHRYDQEKSKLEYSEIMRNRYAKLLQTNTVSQAEYDAKKTQYDIAYTNYKQAEKALEDTALYAPFSGLVAQKFVDNFEFVQSRQPIISLQDITEIEIVIFIPEQDIIRAAQIVRFKLNEKTKMVGTVSFPTIPKEEFFVRTKQIATEADTKTQTYRATLILERPAKHTILPGMTANVSLKFHGEHSDTYLVPTTAVNFSAEGTSFVWIVNPDQKTVTKRVVDIGDMSDQKIRVLKGLNRNDEIVVAGGAYLVDGEKIRIIEGKIGR